MSKKVFIAEQETLLEVQEQVEKLVVHTGAIYFQNVKKFFLVPTV
mgnify:CR=1 FL=1